MNERTLRVLEYDKIIEYLKSFAVSDYGYKKCIETKPFTDLGNVTRLLDETTEAMNLKENLPGGIFSGVKDTRKSINKSKVSGIHLNPMELLDIAWLAKVSREVKEIFKKIDEDYPKLSIYIQNIEPIIQIENSIFPCFDHDGNILDTASKQLHSIRKKLIKLENSVKVKLEDILGKKEFELVFQDKYVTIRNSKYVIPVKSSFKNKIPGMVVDRSSTGQSLFIQPLEIVEIDNEITQLRLEEDEEIIRILKELTGLVRYNQPILLENLEMIAEIDQIYARMKLSEKWNGNRPDFCDKFGINIKEGYHPILLELQNKGKIEKAIPFDIELVDEKVLVITGPNTGGKTAALKTIGIISLLFQSGIFPPVNEESFLPIFSSIFADIGDEQSFEQNLSTFSSHMKNIVNIVENIEDTTLVLLDEIGAGTDPEEGSSLSVAILEELIKKDVKIIVTTHHRLLKTLAYSKNEFKNAAMEFDDGSLMPTYRIRMGLPGRSNALEVSKNLGLKNDIIDRARSITGSDAMQLDELIKKLEGESKSIEILKKELTELKKTSEVQKKRLQDKESFIKYDSYLEAEGILLQAKNIFSKAEGALHKQNLTIDDIKSMKKNVETEIEKIGKVQESRFEKRMKNVKEIKEGDTIFIKSLKKSGKIISIDRKTNRMKVQAGSIVVDVDLKDNKFYAEPIKKIDKPNETVVKIDGPAEMADTFTPEINIIGKRTDEGSDMILKFIDDAVLVNMDKIRIIHGVGTGRLKKSIHELLKHHPNVSNFFLDIHNPGGDGVTVVELK